jgi:hypothetical protein
LNLLPEPSGGEPPARLSQLPWLRRFFILVVDDREGVSTLLT